MASLMTVSASASALSSAVRSPLASRGAHSGSMCLGIIPRTRALTSGEGSSCRRLSLSALLLKSATVARGNLSFWSCLLHSSTGVSSRAALPSKNPAPNVLPSPTDPGVPVPEVIIHAIAPFTYTSNVGDSLMFGAQPVVPPLSLLP